MTINDHARVCNAFREAFGPDLPPPTWDECKDLVSVDVLRAIASVKANPLSKFNRNKVGLVLRAATKKKRGGRYRRSRAQKPFYGSAKPRG